MAGRQGLLLVGGAAHAASFSPLVTRLAGIVPVCSDTPCGLRNNFMITAAGRGAGGGEGELGDADFGGRASRRSSIIELLNYLTASKM
ncbi:hypothetical protein DLE60_28925 [Micromonospora globispora]|uniref:hypothetical protein n=1 Tax=Micromonospora globispora TaxID=1450148 RepID=UPI000D6FD2C1|nr:hypothetical protein [Micromonospora globispora]PWU55007.1 hypothetical protein DLE60_28925 [Micromonospora globispora]